MKISKRRTKTGCTIRITAETTADGERLMELLLSGQLVRHWMLYWMPAGQLPASIELTAKASLPAKPEESAGGRK